MMFGLSTEIFLCWHSCGQKNAMLSRMLYSTKNVYDDGWRDILVARV
jgi:hypothetical protein